MNQLSNCILTGYNLNSPIQLESVLEPYISYEHIAVGKAKIELPVLLDLMNTNQYKNPILAGICRNASENEQEPPIITTDFIQTEIENISFPKSFEEKWRYLLKYMYDKGGKDFKPIDFTSTKDYPVCFAESQEEFQQIIEALEEKKLLRWSDRRPARTGIVIYKNTYLTDPKGIDEVEKGLPKMPLVGLVNQEITTGDSKIDDNINHARKLFFQEPQDMGRMRSACETLCFVLEPLRKDLHNCFKSKDIEDFFQIVNKFDIRHNKEHTKNIEHSEQLEWIFYSLLNTINTYTKLKKRLG